jgi:hypothetical protein
MKGRMRYLLALSLLLGACNRISPVDADGSPGASDALVADAGPCADWARTPSLFDPCQDITQEDGDLVLSLTGTYLYDTDTGTLTDPQGGAVPHVNSIVGSARAVVAGRFVLGVTSTLRAIGARPLLIVSWSAIQVSGTIDVSSSPVTGRGAGANALECTGAGIGTTNLSGGGGGGGGGFGASGGTGGTGALTESAGGVGGMQLAQAFHGGCPGGEGGEGDALGAGVGGNGGGALFLSARTNLIIAGVLQAGGEGGSAAAGGRCGGGGGGSGGFIGLEAEAIELESGSVVAANGGGGGGGVNLLAGSSGDSGGPSDEAASGGLGEATPDGDGGEGGYLSVDAGQVGSDSSRGGGGGGGSVGHIFFSTISISNVATVSPAPTIML